jgi:hypothetical protein
LAKTFNILRHYYATPACLGRHQQRNINRMISICVALPIVAKANWGDIMMAQNYGRFCQKTLLM